MADDEVQAPSLTTFQPTGLFSEPIGNVATEQEGGEVFPSTSFEGQDWFGLSRQVGRGIQRGYAAATGEQTLDPDTLNKTYGIPGHLKFDSALAPSVAQSMSDAKHEELAREDAAARTPDGFYPKAARLGAGFVAGALDPLNVAAAFVPGVGEARLAGLLGLGAVADLGLGGRLAVRALEGASAGVIGQVPLVGLRYGLSQQEQADYSGMDALGDILMGGALGAGLHTAGGAVADLFRDTPARVAPERAEALRDAGIRPEVAAAEATGSASITPDEAAQLREINSSPETAEAASRTAVAQMAQGFPIDVSPVIDAEPPVEGTPGATPYVRQPREPQSLSDFLHANGGIRDVGGDIRSSLGRAMDRPGLINRNGLDLDKAAEMAWDAGYFPEHDQRPSINDLLDRLHEDVRGNPQYSSHAEAETAAFHEAMAHNAEIDRLAARTGIDTADKTREQFFDAVADHMSQAEHLEAIAHAEDAHAAAFGEFERLARDEGHWQPPDESRSLEDLEREYRQEATAPAAGNRGGSAATTGDLGQPAGGGEAGGRSGGRGARDAGRLGAEGSSDAFDRAAGYAHGDMTPEDEALDRSIAELLAKVKPDEPGIPPQVEADMEDLNSYFAAADTGGKLTQADREEIDASKTWVDQAKALGKGAMQAGMCLFRSA